MAKPKFPNRDELHAALAAGKEHTAALLSAPDKAWAKHIKPDYIFKAVSEGNIPAFMVGDFLVIFTIAPAWFNPDALFFTELLTLRVTSGVVQPSSFRAVVRGIEHVARSNGCVGVMLGTIGAKDSRLERVLRRLGYVGQAATLYKEIQ